ncbi:uncharacterized protein LOC120089100 [Benincasa hispida]|uniref:uncharacterized protein LOC120089100 n=1 Tax=Benincasa hispida TaxID=102211 RepID=UPI00190133B1|nr:uncharacterized protein LOC120089100 [Benincasa hispida]
MAVARYEIEKFTGNGDFQLWMNRIQEALAFQKALRAIEDPKTSPTAITDEKKQNMEEVAYEALILNISNSVLRQVISENTTYEVWEKLKKLYLKKDVPNKRYVREKLFSFKMNALKSLDANLDKFKKLAIEFAQMGISLGEDDETTIVIYSLHESYKDVKATLKYGRGFNFY